MTEAELAFAVYGVATQALLLGFFAARRWLPRLANRFGWVVYAFAALGLPIGAWLLLDGQSWRLFVGPLLMAGWAFVGTIVDLWRPRQWRRPPVVWRVFFRTWPFTSSPRCSSGGPCGTSSGPHGRYSSCCSF